MSRRKRNWYEDQKDDPDTDRGLFERIIEGVIGFVICCFLIKLGISYLISVKVPLIIIAAIVGIATISYETARRRRNCLQRRTVVYFSRNSCSPSGQEYEVPVC